MKNGQAVGNWSWVSNYPVSAALPDLVLSSAGYMCIHIFQNYLKIAETMPVFFSENNGTF